ncbi:MAG: hypothetical protein Q4G05_00955 [Clostridia bacterium]|nr:hypothetical protein [Clostridia bacterium]
MENASKALIIAGAILLSILLIGIGVYIYSSANDVIKGMNMNDTEIQAFNSKFEAYEGTKSGSEVKALIDLVRTHNLSNVDDVSRQVSVVAAAATKVDDLVASDITGLKYAELKNAVKASYTYTVNITYNKNSGLVTQVGYVKK